MPKFSPVALLWATFYAVAWAGSVWVLSNAGGENAEEAMTLAPIFALIGPLMAWGLTAVGRRETQPIAVSPPERDSAMLPSPFASSVAPHAAASGSASAANPTSQPKRRL